MAGAEHGNTEADVGEGRMAASEGANGGEYADEGQDGRGKKYYKSVWVCVSILRRFSSERSSRNENKIVFEMHILTAFRRPIYLRSLSLHFNMPLIFSQMFLTLCFSFARRHGTFQQVAENPIQTFLRGC